MRMNVINLSELHGRAIAQEVSRWLPTAAARVQTRVYSCGICGGQSGAGAGFLRVLQFPLSIFITPISPQSASPIIRGWYNRPVVAAVPKVPPHKLKKKFKLNCIFVSGKLTGRDTKGVIKSSRGLRLRISISRIS
jgi:hypothetical protein